MSRATFVRWTCNVCASEVETVADEQPADWVGYSLTAPGTPAAERSIIGHLCGECMAKVKADLGQKPHLTIKDF